IARAHFLQVDLDSQSGEELEAAKDRALAKLNAMSMPATVIGDSGNGLNALWRLNEPVPLDSPEAIASVEATNQALSAMVGGDSTWDVSRIFRLPGTMNLPTKTKRAKGRVQCPSRLLHLNGAAYSL